MLNDGGLNNLLVEGYKSNIEILVQQKGSKLSKCVSNAKQRSKREVYEALSKVEASKLDLSTQRDKETKIASGGSRSRYIADLQTYEWADLIYREDKINSLGDPASVYAINAAYALGRAKDKAIIEGALGNLEKVVSDSSVIISFDSSGKIAHGNKSLTIEKLRKARTIFNEKDVDPDDEQFIAVTGKEMSSLLKEIQSQQNIPFHESDLVQGLVEGRVKRFLGFTFKIVSSSLFTTPSGYSRRLPLWSKSAILLSTGQDISVDIQRRPDRRNALQVYASMECTAIRLDPNGVLEIQCKDS